MNASFRHSRRLLAGIQTAHRLGADVCQYDELLAAFTIALGKGGQNAPRLGCQQRFDALDTNRDGQVTNDEFLAAPHQRGNAEQMFKAMDVNGRG
jgi:hypothetical protein